MPNLKAAGPTVAVIRFDPAKFASLRRDQVDHAAYHIARLLAGEGTAESEWTHVGTVKTLAEKQTLMNAFVSCRHHRERIFPIT